MTEEDLGAIEQLMKQRRHVILAEEGWSRGMANAMLDKIPELIQEVRNFQKDRERMMELIKKAIENRRELSQAWALWFKGMDAKMEQCPEYRVVEALERILNETEKLSRECRA
jgi:cytochrome P450